MRPSSLGALVAGLVEARGAGAVLAGGTDLLVKIRAGSVKPRVLFDVAAVPELHGLAEEGEFLRIGAAVTLADIARSLLVRGKAPLLADSAAQIGANQIRNRATIGGNIVNGSPAADLLPSLLVTGAMLKLVGAHGERWAGIETFYDGPGLTRRSADEVLVEVLVPADRPGIRSRFLKVGRRRALAISVVNVAARLELREGIIRDARIALGAVAPTVMRAHRAEALLQGRAANSPLLAAAAEAAAEIQPIDDVRASADGRRRLVKAWVCRLLRMLLEGDTQ